MYVLIVGAGKVGWNLARELIGKRHEVTVIEANQQRYAIVEEELEHSVHYGDGSELWVLERAGIERADLVIAVTGDDEDNILICQVAREKYGVARVVARCNNPRNLQHFELLGAKPAVSATDLILRLIEHEVPKYGLVHLLDLPEERLEIIELEGLRALQRGRPSGARPRVARRLARDLDPARRRRLRAVRRIGGPSGRRGADRARRRPRGRRHGALRRPLQHARLARGAAQRRPSADRRRPGGRQLRALAARGGRRGVGAARRSRVRSALQPSAAVQGLPPRGGGQGGRALSPGRMVVRAGRRAAHAHERDEARRRRARRDALHARRGQLRQGADRDRCQRPPSARGRLRPRGHPLSAGLRQLRRDPRERRAGRARGADRRQLHRLRGGRLADRSLRRPVFAGDAGAAHARTHLRRAHRRLLPGRPRRSTGSRSTAARSSSASRATASACAGSSPAAAWSSTATSR